MNCPIIKAHCILICFVKGLIEWLLDEEGRFEFSAYYNPVFGYRDGKDGLHQMQQNAVGGTPVDCTRRRCLAGGLLV